MSPTFRVLFKLATLVLPVSAFAQEPPQSSTRWSIGAGTSVTASPYAGEETRIRLIPLIGYEGQRFFLRGASGGVHLYNSDQFTFDAILSARLDGFDASDLGRAELRANGVNRDLLSDRDDGIDAGVRATYRTAYGDIALEALHDISDASDGYEVSLDYRYTWHISRATLTANAGASWMSSRLAGYYFGTLDEEVSRGVTEYSPGSAVTPHIGMTLMQPIGSTKWALLGAVEYRHLQSELRDSPLLESDRNGIAQLVIGLSRRF